MKKLLTMWMEAQIQKYVPLSLMTIKAEARNLFEDQKGNVLKECTSLLQAVVWFSRFEACSSSHKLKCLVWLQNCIDEGLDLSDQV
jgi:hypothetical protein